MNTACVHGASATVCRVSRWLGAVAMCAGGLAAAQAAPPPQLATIVEGPAIVIRGTERLALVEGVPLQPEDIVETGPAGFVRIEFADRSAVEFGPDTRALLMTRVAGAGARVPPRVAYLLQGWVKLVARRGGTAQYRGFASSSIGAADIGGTLVLRIDARGASAFAESGEARLIERRDSGPPVEHMLKPGAFLARPTAQKATLASRPGEDFLREMPPPFRDTLPERAGQFAGREIRPKSLSAPRYEDLEPWLKAEPALRREFVRRWRARAADAAFRAALVANLRAHPEWDPILFPEKYLPRTPDGGPTASPAARDREQGYPTGQAGQPSR